MLGIAVGMLAIIIMLSLMNRLQSDLLDQVKSVESFHVQVSFPANESDVRTVDEIVSALRGTPGVVQVYPQVNTQVLIQNPTTNTSTTARLRIIDSSIWKTENPFSERTYMVRGSYPTPLHIATGASLATKLSLALGDSVHMTVLGAGKTVVLAPTTLTVTASGDVDY
jgi:ABC-type lipoprotein release transport system permease subunit